MIERITDEMSGIEIITTEVEVITQEAEIISPDIKLDKLETQDAFGVNKSSSARDTSEALKEVEDNIDLVLVLRTIVALYRVIREVIEELSKPNSRLSVSLQRLSKAENNIPENYINFFTALFIYYYNETLYVNEEILSLNGFNSFIHRLLGSFIDDLSLVEEYEFDFNNYIHEAFKINTLLSADNIIYHGGLSTNFRNLIESMTADGELIITFVKHFNNIFGGSES